MSRAHECKYDSDGGPCRICGKTVAEQIGSLAPVPGYVAQPWTVEPTRAGWWWWLDKRTGLTELVNVKNFGTPWAPHLCAYGDGWGGYTIPMMREYKPGWWAGPVEPPEPPREEPPHSD